MYFVFFYSFCALFKYILSKTSLSLYIQNILFLIVTSVLGFYILDRQIVIIYHIVRLAYNHIKKKYK